MTFCKYHTTYKLYNLGFFTRCTVKALQKLQGQVCIELFRWCLLYLNWTGYMTLLCPTIFSIIEVFNRPFCCNKNLFLQVLWSFSRCIFLKNQEYIPGRRWAIGSVSIRCIPMTESDRIPTVGILSDLNWFPYFPTYSDYRIPMKSEGRIR